MSSGLSPDEQRNMFHLLEEALAERRALESRMESLIAQNRTLESHLVELMAAVKQQREIPAQVMLRRPVILIDAFEENRLPFHLEFINSFEALFAVFMVRFKHRGDGALMRIRRQMFDMYESSMQKRINLNGPWANAFLVSTPLTLSRNEIADHPVAWTVRGNEYACPSTIRTFSVSLSGLSPSR